MMIYRPKPAERHLLQSLSPDQLQAIVSWLDECNSDYKDLPNIAEIVQRLATRCHSLSLATVTLTVLLTDTGQLTAIECCPSPAGELFYSVHLSPGQRQDEFLSWLHPKDSQSLTIQRDLNDTLKELSDHKPHTMMMSYAFWFSYTPQPVEQDHL
ncbi:MAG: hypothetical protein AAFU71_03390 [Cyanobacteria bacterium J06632_22]